MTTLADIQKRAAVLSQSRDLLAGLIRTMQAGIETVKNGALPDIKRAARQITKQHIELDQLIRANPELFAKPRTHVVDSLKFGLKKQPGKMDWTDDDKLCSRIHDLVKDGTLSEDQQAMLITTVEKPVAKALEKLDGNVLKRLGVTIGNDTDATVITSVDGEVEKMVAAMVKDATKDAGQEVEQ